MSLKEGSASLIMEVDEVLVMVLNIEYDWIKGYRCLVLYTTPKKWDSREITKIALLIFVEGNEVELRKKRTASSGS